MPRPHSSSIYKGAANKRPSQPTILSLWLKSHGISRDKFARQVGCSGKNVDFWCDGKTIPTLHFAFMIEKETEGGVPAETWLGTDIGKHLWTEIQKRVKAS